MPASNLRYTVIIKLLSGLLYLGYIVFLSKNSSVHMAHLQQELILLRDARLTLKQKKCSFSTEKIKHPGLAIRAGRPELSEAINTAVREFRNLPAQMELRFFLGFCNPSPSSFRTSQECLHR